MRILPPGTLIPNRKKKRFFPLVPLFFASAFVLIAVAANKIVGYFWP